MPGSRLISGLLVDSQTARQTHNLLLNTEASNKQIGASKMLTVTAQQVASYQENGFVVLPDLLTATELDSWRQVIERATAARVTRLPLKGENYEDSFHEGGYSESDEYYNNVFTQKINLWMTDQDARELVLNEALGKVATELAGVEGMRIWLDQALVKEPWGNPTAFHIDVPFWGFTSPHALTIWIALSDSTLVNGALGYIPGSHKLEEYTNSQVAPDLGAIFRIYPQIADIEPVFCPVKAGSAVVHNGLTVHGAGANMTPNRRFAMTVAYMPDGATFNGQQDILPNEYVTDRAVGDVLNDEEYNPLVYRVG
jgi:ectoine hydroxylase-related dioxygenase (phytanoyl-CoA dioxygenase family)